MLQIFNPGYDPKVDRPNSLPYVQQLANVTFLNKIKPETKQKLMFDFKCSFVKIRFMFLLLTPLNISKKHSWFRREVR